MPQAHQQCHWQPLALKATEVAAEAAADVDAAAAAHCAAADAGTNAACQHVKVSSMLVVSQAGLSGGELCLQCLHAWKLPT